MPAVGKSPGRTGHQTRGWILDSCGFWAFLVGRSQSHNCQSWSCWKGNGAEEGAEGTKEKHSFKVNFELVPAVHIQGLTAVAVREIVRYNKKYASILLLACHAFSF